MRDERGERRAQPLGVRVAQRHERASAPLDEQHGLAVEQDDVRSGDAGSTGSRTPGPGECGAVRLRGIGGGEHERPHTGVGAQLAQPLDRARQGELGAPEALHEVAAPTAADRLQSAKLAVDGSVSTRDALAAHAVTDDDALALEQQLREGAPIATAGREEPGGQRPAALRRRGRETARAREPARPTRRDGCAVAAFRPQRRPGVVRHLARPDELPQGGQRTLRVQARRLQDVLPEFRGAGEGLPQRRRRLAFRKRRPHGRAEHSGILTEEERDPVEAGTDPDDLAGGAEPVEPGRLVAGHAPRQHLGLPQRHRQRERLQGHERLVQGGAPVDSVPHREEAPESGPLGGLDLAAQRRERCATQAPEHLRVAPLTLDTAGTELAADEPVVPLERRQHLPHALRRECVAHRRLVRREGAAGPGEPCEQHREGIDDGVEVRGRQASGRHHPEGVPEQACVVGRDQPLLTGDPHPQGAPFGLEQRGKRRIDLVVSQVAPAAQQVVQLVGGAGVAGELRLDVGERDRVDQLAQLLLAEQLAQQVAVERQRLRTPLRRGRVVLVHVGGDVVEQERRGERRGGGRLDFDEVELACLQAVQDPLERRQVEHVLQALAVRLEHDRERPVLARNLQQALGLQALLPQRRALAGAPARDQERPPGVLAEAGAEERGLSHLLHDELLDLVGRHHQVGDRRRRVRLREVQRDSVVRPDRLHLETERVAQARAERHRPGGVHASTERGQDAHAPVADLVTEALHHDRAIGGDDAAARRRLVAQVREQVPCREPVEVVVAVQADERVCVGESDDLAGGATDLLAQLVRTTDPLALPEGHGARHARRRRDEHPVAGDLLDAPRGGTEQEGLTLARLVHHLLVELADTAAAVDLEDAVEAAVGNGAGVRDGQPAGPLPAPDDACGAIPDDARAQLGELVGRVAAGEHVEHVLELLARQLREGVGAADELVQVVDGDLVLGADGHHLLCQHVERVAGDRRLLDRPLTHRLGDDRGLQQVGAELREDTALRDGVEIVPGPPHPLQAAGDGLRALDLHDEVDSAHVDAELEARSRDEARDPAGLQELLDLDALLAGQRPVVRPRDLLLRQLVQPSREPLGEPAVVDENDRRAVLPHEVEERRVDRRPDRAGGRLVAGCHLDTVGQDRLREPEVRAELAHVLERDDHLEVERLARAGVHELDGTAAGDEAADLLERSLRGREADPLKRAVRHTSEPLQRHGEMGAALGAGDSVHLVEDDGLDPPQHLPGLRGEEEIERLGCRDQDVGRRAHHLAALALVGVAGAHTDRESRAEARERRPQVALDVVVERLQGRDIEEPQPLAGTRVEPVDAGEEGGERLARAGRRLHEHVRTGRDHRPGGLLGRGRRRERPLEPGARLRRECSQRVHPANVPRRVGSNHDARGTALHRRSRGGCAARPRAARAHDRVRARPAGDRAEGVLVAARAVPAARGPRRCQDRSDGS